MSMTLTFVALSCEQTLEELGTLFLLSGSRLLPLMSSLCEGVWVLDLWGWEEKRRERKPVGGVWVRWVLV